jgi:hypothetical protein
MLKITMIINLQTVRAIYFEKYICMQINCQWRVSRAIKIRTINHLNNYVSKTLLIFVIQRQ